MVVEVWIASPWCLEIAKQGLESLEVCFILADSWESLVWSSQVKLLADSWISIVESVADGDAVPVRASWNSKSSHTLECLKTSLGRKYSKVENNNLDQGPNICQGVVGHVILCSVYLFQTICIGNSI